MCKVLKDPPNILEAITFKGNSQLISVSLFLFNILLNTTNNEISKCFLFTEIYSTENGWFKFTLQSNLWSTF